MRPANGSLVDGAVLGYHAEHQASRFLTAITRLKENPHSRFLEQRCRLSFEYLVELATCTDK